MWAIRSFEQLPSTQSWLIGAIRSGEVTQPLAVITRQQTQGRGSRGNTWEGGEGNLFASVAIEGSSLPSDLLPQSASIYFAWLIREVLGEIDPHVRLKWPNDLYLDREKIGGILTQKIGRYYVVGIGINLSEGATTYRALPTDQPPQRVLEKILKRFGSPPTWKDVFSKFKLEFAFSRAFSSHHEGAEISLRDAELCDDGSLQINEKRIYSLR